jgi:hypothetical protein
VASAHEWQSLIAGLIGGGLGVVAGVIAYVGAIRAARRQIADAQAARRQADERRLSVIKWAVRVEARRLAIAVLALRDNALPSKPQAANRYKEQLIIKSSPLLRGEREEISLLDDQTRALLEELAGIVDEYNARIETAVFLGTGPMIERETLGLLNRLDEAVQKMPTRISRDGP